MAYHFGRIHSPFDSRDYNLDNFIPMGATVKEGDSQKWEFPGLVLDQGETNHCVGFSIANFGINNPVYTPYTNKDAHDLYYQCKVIDGQPNNEEGSTIRSAAKCLQKNGRIEAYAFAPTLTSIRWWLLNRGPLIVGTIWLNDMFSPDENQIIRATGDLVGGHAYLLNEWRSDNYIGIQNSWGNTWGVNGKAYISSTDFEKLFLYDGEAMAAVELESNTNTKECILITLIKKLIGTSVN